MIGFQEVIPIFVVAAFAWFLGPKVWNGLRKGALQAAKDTKEFSSELSTIVKEDVKPKENKQPVDSNIVSIVVEDTKRKEDTKKL